LRSRLASLSSSAPAFSFSLPFSFFFFRSASSSAVTSDVRFLFFSFLSEASPCDDSPMDAVATTGRGVDPDAGMIVEGPGMFGGGTYGKRLVYLRKEIAQ
jgi:hypothetical protein